VRTCVIALLLCLALPASAHEALSISIQRVSEQIEATPDDPHLRQHRIDLYLADGHYADALSDLDELEALTPGAPEIYAGRAEVFFATEQPRDAIANLDAHIELTGGTLRSLWLRGQLHEQALRVGDALADYDAALERGNLVDIYLARARLLVRQGDPIRACEGLAQGIDRMAGSVLLRTELLDVCAMVGNTHCALEQVDAILSQARVQTRWLLRRADLFQSEGRRDEASRDRREALRQADRLVERRGSALSYLDRARVHLALNETELARADLDTALRLLPTSTLEAEVRELLDEVTP